jgi:hypothetical protein
MHASMVIYDHAINNGYLQTNLTKVIVKEMQGNWSSLMFKLQFLQLL